MAINEKSKEFDFDKYTILRNGKYIRAKIRTIGRVRWVHTGSAAEWGSKSDKELYEVCKKKLSKHFTQNR